MQSDEKFTSNKDMMGMMELELFKKIIDEAYELGTKAITLTGRGEPTLNPHIEEMLEYCSGKFIEIKMNTNATVLNERMCHKILKSGLTDLVFSVDSYYKEEFESLRVNANFGNIFESDLKSVWNNKYYVSARSTWSKDPQNDQLVICNMCKNDTHNPNLLRVGNTFSLTTNNLTKRE
jgi:MoaA/NifB/PqqE/SkfB family radical SAM enzyme